jgi:hypothetical protein
MLAVKDQVKDKLLSTPLTTTVEPEPPATKETRLAFMKYAEPDGETGEWYLNEAHFIDALAPGKEDYVSMTLDVTPVTDKCDSTKSSGSSMASSSVLPTAARPAASAWLTGPTSRTSLPSPMPSTR